MKVLVTGGTGLLSGPVVSHLLARGADVTIFHRSASGDGGPVRELLGDRADQASFVRMVREAGPWDCLVEMIGGVPGDARSLVELAQGGIPHLIFCSTTTVYGRPFVKVPVVEEGAVLAPPSAYGEGKLACEQILREEESRGDFDVTIIRPAHIYNERSLVLHSLGNRTSHLDRIREGRPIVVHEDGEGRWSSLWAEEAASAVAAAVYSGAARGQTYHLAGSEPFTWNAYHDLLATALEAPRPEKIHIPVEKLVELAPDRTLQLRRTLQFPGVYDCSAATRDLGFCPMVVPSEGLTRNVQYLRNHKLIEPWRDDEDYEKVVRAFVED